MNLLIVGSVATDTIDTPFGCIKNGLGGSATYASVAASYFSSPGIVGVVGKDFERKHINLLKRKGVDLLVYNDVSEPGSGFGTDTNRVVFIEPDGSTKALPLLSKREVAVKLWDRVASALEARG